MGTQFFLNSSRRSVLAGAIVALTLTSGVNGQTQDKPAGPAAPQPPATQSQPRCRDSSSPRAARPC